MFIVYLSDVSVLIVYLSDVSVLIVYLSDVSVMSIFLGLLLDVANTSIKAVFIVIGFIVWMILMELMMGYPTVICSKLGEIVELMCCTTSLV